MKTLPDSVLDSIVTCNRFAFRGLAGSYSGKPLFYCLKEQIIRAYGTFDGYDHQHFWKYKHYWAQFYHYDMQWTYNEATPPEVWKHHLYDVWSKERDDPNDYFEVSESDDDMRIIGGNDVMVRCVSEHRHILERWIVRGETREILLHKPIDEYFYRAFRTDRHPEIVKHSPRFFEFAAKCTSQMNTVGDERTPDGVKPFAEFKSLTRWIRAEQPVLYNEIKTRVRVVRDGSHV